MIYLDYSATTPVNEEVLDSFIKTSKNFIGNSNSLHNLGVNSKKLEEQATKQIAEILKIDNFDIIYTSGATESNNTAIKGICEKYKNRGKRIITTNLEHSSIYGPLEYLEKQGFIIEYLKTNNGLIDLEHLKELLSKNDTILVTIASVNSETGIMQPINEIGMIIKEYPKTFFHVDMTQSIGKINIPFDNVDLASFSAHKFYGIKGIGALLKRKNIIIEPLIHGGKSTTVYRSGTPALPLIVSMSKALRLSVNSIEDNLNKIEQYNNKIKQALSKYEYVHINSNESSIPHILNISFSLAKPETLQHSFEEYDIYISTQSACSSNNEVSRAVYDVTKSEEYASHSIRISLSNLTTEEEINKFLKAFEQIYTKFNKLYK